LKEKIMEQETQDDFEEWYDKYREALDEEGALGIADVEMARRSFRRRVSPEQAAKADIRFAFEGEQ